MDRTKLRPPVSDAEISRRERKAQEQAEARLKLSTPTRHDLNEAGERLRLCVESNTELVVKRLDEQTGTMRDEMGVDFRAIMKAIESAHTRTVDELHIRSRLHVRLTLACSVFASVATWALVHFVQ